jgi:hypothetical protein
MSKELKHITFDEETLRNLCAWWQSVLGLQDWDVKLRLKRASEMKEDALGECEWQLSTLTAVIRILDPIDYDNDLFKLDHEKVLVHELLHLLISPYDETEEGSIEEVKVHQAIEKLSKALVNLKRS